MMTEFLTWIQSLLNQKETFSFSDSNFLQYTSYRFEIDFNTNNNKRKDRGGALSSFALTVFALVPARTIARRRPARPAVDSTRTV
jgi:hypothetical protein